jgi:hypothetical protein
MNSYPLHFGSARRSGGLIYALFVGHINLPL